MSVLKNLDIDLPQSEKRTLVNFLSLYIFFIVVILGFMAFLYYGFQKDLITQEKKLLLNEYANEFIVRLENTTISKNKNIYPKDEHFTSAIYDKDYKLIYSTIKNPKSTLDQVVYTDNSAIRYIKNPKLYYMNTQYILIEIKDDKQWFTTTIKTIMLFGTIAFIFMLIIGYFLLRLFLKPMRDALHLLDTFIKDTTHELNTPVSTIVANIEMIDTSKLTDEKLVKKINRIDIGAKTISNIYNDLTYLILNNKIISQNKELNLKEIIKQRVEYFNTLAMAKKIIITTKLDDNITLYIDDKKISKLLDNLISNAIKYNKVNGQIHIELKPNFISIKDTGRGISKENIKLIFDRYSRFDKSVGGFGIGLNIVKLICNEYKLHVHIDSKLEEYTSIKLTW